MKTKAFIFIIVAGILWGTSGIFVNYLAPYGFTSMQMTSMPTAAVMMYLPDSIKDTYDIAKYLESMDNVRLCIQEVGETTQRNVEYRRGVGII